MEFNLDKLSVRGAPGEFWSPGESHDHMWGAVLAGEALCGQYPHVGDTVHTIGI